MRKADLVAVYGTYEAIGALFAPFNSGKPITRSAVAQWDEQIPELREFQVRAIDPQIDQKIKAARKRAA